MLHVLGWAGLGVLVGVAAWWLRPRPRPLHLVVMLLLSVAGAVFTGFVSWIFWDFPGNPAVISEFLTVPALVSDCLAVLGALSAISLATGVVMFEKLNGGRWRRRG